MTHLRFPLGKLFTILTKQYIALLSDRLAHLPIERYYYVLYVIGQHSGKIGQYQLGELLGLDKVTIFRTVDYLEKNDMIERIPNPDDRRCQLLLISGKGKAILPEIENALNELDAFFLSALDQEHRATFEHQLLQLVEKTTEIPTKRMDVQFNKITDPNEEE